MSALWLVRFVIEAYFGLVQAAPVLGLVAIGAYGAYRIWVGRTGADAEDSPG